MEDPSRAKEVKGKGVAESPNLHGGAMVRLEAFNDYGRSGRMEDYTGAKGS
ncbi:hypothetical protein M9458_003241, partial [Cirrhinus mrigala]